MAESSIASPLLGRPVARFLRLLSVDRKEIIYIYIYAVFTGVIYLSLPLGIQAIISQVLANELSSSWVLLIVVVTLGTVVVGGLHIMQMSITEMLQQRIFARAAFEFAYRLPRIRMDALTNYYPPELVNRFFDTLNIQKGLPKILIDLSTASLQILFGLILLSFYHPFFVAFGIFLLGLLYIIFRITGPKGLRTSLAESDYKYQVVFWLEEIARTLSTFKLAGDTPIALTKVNDLVTKYLGARKAHFRVLISQFANVVAFKTIVTAGLLILGSLLLIQRELNVGQFVASEIIILIVISSVEKLILSMDTIYDVLTAVEKIGKITDLPLEKHEGIAFDRIDRGDGIAIMTKDLKFTWPKEEEASLKGIDLNIKAGEKICIAGKSGSGKTLLLNVLSGLYDNYSGLIAFNDMNIRNLDPIQVRAYIGDCLSQKILFRGTLEENLNMGNPHITFQDVRWAIDRLQLEDFIHTLPDGLMTELVPEGPQYPQGIVRKLILARCVAKRPQLLVMDDFFTIWEPEDRKSICAFLTCHEMKTVIAVSNDRTYASMSDRIIVMDKGRIIDTGTYEEIQQKPYASEIFHG